MFLLVFEYLRLFRIEERFYLLLLPRLLIIILPRTPLQHLKAITQTITSLKFNKINATRDGDSDGNGDGDGTIERPSTAKVSRVLSV